MDFKNINIMVGMAALFSTVTLNSLANDLSENHIHKIANYEIQSDSKIYTVLTPLKEVIPQNLKGFKEYDEYAHSIMMSNSSQIFLTKDVGNNFVIYMIPHHEAAIITSIGALKYTHNLEVKNLANRIIHAQEREVEVMQKLLETGELRGNDNGQFLDKMKKIMTDMMGEMKSYNGQVSSGEAITKHYLENMIVHHKGAINMANMYLKYGKNPELIKMSQKIILSQDEEIKEMEQILKRAK
ncbi:DUF305 domain-containing protein [Cetobacterium sp.]|uniref:DUF305 domain-containing protein n=1 Tax=Cetobacterium sp. TaxID=2071632 RepID=UPI003AF0213B